MEVWAEDSPMKDIAMTAVYAMQTLLLYKPSKISKSKDHTKALGRLKIFEEGS